MSGNFRRGRDGPSPPQRLQPIPTPSRASSSRSEASRSSRSKSQDSEPNSPIAEGSESHYTITGVLSPRQRVQIPQKKVHDQWAKLFSKWREIRTRLDDQLVVDSHKENCPELSRIAYLLKLSRDPEQDDQLHHLESFMGDADSVFAIPIDDSSGDPVVDRERQQPRGFIEHLVWLEGWAKPMTIPEQPNKILSILELEAKLKPIRPSQIFDYNPNSFYRRLVYVSDADPPAMAAMIKQATISQSGALGELFRGYFKLKPEFSLQVEVTPMPAKVANMVYHMPYLCICKEKRKDIRFVGNEPLRATYELSCLEVLAPDIKWGPSARKLYLNEGMMSVALNVRDDRWSNVTCLNDEFLNGKLRLEEEQGDEEDCVEEDAGERARTTQKNRAGERTGLQPLDLEWGDPILNEAGGYTDQHPRVYMLIVLDTQLEIWVRHHEVVFVTFNQTIRSYSESGLPRADMPRSLVNDTPKAKIKDALDDASMFLGKLLRLVKQQEEETRRFLEKGLGLDLEAKRPTFRDSLFVGLNKLNDPSAKESAMRVMLLVARLHKLRHGIDDLLEMVASLRKTVSTNIVEDLQVAQHDYASRGLKLGILHYVSQALTIPLNLYNIPHAVTRLPDNSTGLTQVTLGLTSLFLVAPFLLALLFKLLAFLRGYALFCWRRFWRSRLMKSRRE